MKRRFVPIFIFLILFWVPNSNSETIFFYFENNTFHASNCPQDVKYLKGLEIFKRDYGFLLKHDDTKWESFFENSLDRFAVRTYKDFIIIK